MEQCNNTHMFDEESASVVRSQREIAEALGLSLGTVHRALSGKGSVGEATLSRVLEYTRRHHYTVNRIAASQLGKKTSIIGLVLPECHKGFYGLQAEGVVQAAETAGYSVIEHSLSGQSGLDLATRIQRLRECRVDGLVLHPIALAGERKALAGAIAERIPMVFIGGLQPDLRVPFVDVPNMDAAEAGVRPLIALGHECIGLILLASGTPIASQRLAGIMRAYEDAGLSVDPALIWQPDTRPSDLRPFEYFMRMKTPPSAVFACSDSDALACYRDAYHAGMRIGKDIAIMGFGGSPLDEIVVPSLSTVDQMPMEMGRLAFETLMEIMHGQTVEGDAPKDVRYWVKSPFTVVMRDSTGSREGK